MFNIQKILSQGEGITTEFKLAKEQLPLSLFESVCAFLNRNGGHILLGVNNNKTIECINPAKAELFCKNITNLSNNPQKLFPKNPHIAQIFTQMGRSEELGTGIKKVYKYSKDYSGSNEIEFLEKDIFITKIPLGNIFIKNNDTLNDTLNDREKIIMQMISINRYVTQEEIAEKCEVSIETIKRDIKKMQENDMIQRIGSKKTGYWEIIKKAL